MKGRWHFIENDLLWPAVDVERMFRQLENYLALVASYQEYAKERGIEP